MNLDDFDFAILRVMQKNARLKSETIAEQVGLSATACQRRIKRLRDQGVIEHEIAIVNPDMVGGWISLIVQIVLDRGATHTVDEFKRQMRDAPEVQQCFSVTGEYDFVLVVIARDIKDYDQLTRRIFFENALIRKFNTTVSMENIKTSLSLPL